MLQCMYMPTYNGWLRRANPNEWVKYAIIYVSLVYV